jgi:hypothetical protein
MTVEPDLDGDLSLAEMPECHFLPGSQFDQDQEKVVRSNIFCPLYKRKQSPRCVDQW